MATLRRHRLGSENHPDRLGKASRLQPWPAGAPCPHCNSADAALMGMDFRIWVWVVLALAVVILVAVLIAWAKDLPQRELRQHVWAYVFWTLTILAILLFLGW